MIQLKKIFEDTYNKGEKYIASELVYVFQRLGYDVEFKNDAIPEKEHLIYKNNKWFFKKDHEFLNNITPQDFKDYSKAAHRLAQFAASKLKIDFKNIDSEVSPEYQPGGARWHVAEFTREKIGILPEPTTLVQFIRLLQSMDWSYEYSDDHSVWTKGQRARLRLKELFSKLSDEEKMKSFKKYQKMYPKADLSFMPSNKEYSSFSKWLTGV